MQPNNGVTHTYFIQCIFYGGDWPPAGGEWPPAPWGMSSQDVALLVGNGLPPEVQATNNLWGMASHCHKAKLLNNSFGPDLPWSEPSWF